MQFEKSENKRPSLIKSIIAESKKIRAERGEDFFAEKINAEVSTEFISTKIHTSEQKKPEPNFRTLRDSHVKLAHLILQYDKKIIEKNDQALDRKKPRSKSVHLYIDEQLEHFLKIESEKAETKWGLRKNAGLGSLIQKFLGNFIELKKREERQLKHLKKIIEEFKAHLVEFKKNSSDPDDYQQAERSNQKMKVLSNDLVILLSLLEFEERSLLKSLGVDQHRWIDFILRWKFH